MKNGYVEKQKINVTKSFSRFGRGFNQDLDQVFFHFIGLRLSTAGLRFFIGWTMAFQWMDSGFLMDGLQIFKEHQTYRLFRGSGFVGFRMLALLNYTQAGCKALEKK